MHAEILLCYNSSCLPVTVSEDEIWQRDAAAGEYPVSCCDGKTNITVISDTLRPWRESCIINIGSDSRQFFHFNFLLIFAQAKPDLFFLNPVIVTAVYFSFSCFTQGLLSMHLPWSSTKVGEITLCPFVCRQTIHDFICIRNFITAKYTTKYISIQRFPGLLHPKSGKLLGHRGIYLRMNYVFIV